MRPREGGRGERVRHDVGGHDAVGAREVRQVAERRELGGVRVPVRRVRGRVERAVDEHVLDDAELSARRGAEREADGTRPLDDVRLAHERLGAGSATL